MSKRQDRRRFLAASATAVAAPMVVSSGAFAQQDKAAPSDRITVGSIGTGDLGRRHHLAGKLIPNKKIEVVAVCDVDQNHRDQAAMDVLRRTDKRVGIYKDFRDLCDRKDIDAVLIAVPDHWHALCAIYAMEAGKDVYCEKPLSYTIEESKKMLEVARRYGTVFQTGSQQRSENNGRFRLACELARNETIGKVTRIDTYIGDIDSGQWQSPTTPPPELDWNFWLGPAPYVDYTPNRCHYQFRWFSDYSGGKMTDWGAHHNDIAQWALDADGSGPVKVSGKGKFHENGPHDVAAKFDVAYTYANGVEVHCHSDGENGIRITGKDGTVFASRGVVEMTLGDKTYSDRRDKIEKKEHLDIFKEFPEEKFAVKLPVNRGHHEDWLECIQTRKRPICDVEVGHRSVTVCHLGNIAIRLGRELAWDPKAEQFVGDDQANLLLSKPMRAPWHL